MRADVGNDKEDLVYVWTDKHYYNKGKNGINICGSELAPENKFAVPIDIILPHTKDTIRIAFGSTLDQDPFVSSFGVSMLEIYIK